MFQLSGSPKSQAHNHICPTSQIYKMPPKSQVGDDSTQKHKQKLEDFPRL